MSLFLPNDIMEKALIDPFRLTNCQASLDGGLRIREPVLLHVTWLDQCG